MRPRYSLILPVYNGMPYLKSCVETILSTNGSDFELIISNDNSSDGGTDYIEGIKDPRVVKIKPENKLSMTEHWEWALSHASGTWQMFIGQDDGILPYFFELADSLTSLAEQMDLKLICARRAYFFWPGSTKDLVGSTNFHAIDFACKKNLSLDAFQALLFNKAYHHLPQMYGSSFFHIDLLNKARSLQDGNVLCCHPQDANLAAISCSLETHYLRSEMPLSWVGTSYKSAGLAISNSIHGNVKESKAKNKLKELKNEYEERVSSSCYTYLYEAGSFSLCSLRLYFWQALLKTSVLRRKFLDDVLRSKLFKYLLFISFTTFEREKLKNEKTLEMFEDVLKINNISKKCFYLSSFFTRYFLLFGSLVFRGSAILYSKIIRLRVRSIKYKIRFEEEEGAMANSGASVELLIDKSKFNIFSRIK